jgi:aryl carrier-like protein
LGILNEQLSTVLDVSLDALNDDVQLLSIPLWDSMSQLVIAAWIHQETGQTVSIEELKSAKTIGDLKAIYVCRL